MEKAGHPKDQAIAASLKKAGLSNKQGEKMASHDLPSAIEEAKVDAKRTSYVHFVVKDDDGTFDIVTTRTPSRGQVVAEVTPEGRVKQYAECHSEFSSFSETGRDIATANKAPYGSWTNHSESSNFSQTGNSLDNRRPGIRRDRV